jgi:hypothetical protein
MTRLSRTALVLLVAALLAPARTAPSCTCDPEPTLPVALAKSQGSFLGKVVEIGLDYEGRCAYFTFEVTRVFKGSFPSRFRIASPMAGCEESFQRDTSYFVFSLTIDGIVSTFQCMGNRSLDKAPNWSALIGPGRPPSSPATKARR